MNPNRRNFDDRPASLAIVYQNSGPALDMQIADGDTVTLQLGVVPVIVRDISLLGSSRYRGTIDGFEIRFGMGFEGYSIGEVVEFSERQVFGRLRR